MNPQSHTLDFPTFPGIVKWYNVGPKPELGSFPLPESFAIRI